MTTSLAPTEREERIGMLDATRGIAVLGILIMNITGFGLPRAYDDPTNWGGSDGLNLAVWRIAALFFECAACSRCCSAPARCFFCSVTLRATPACCPRICISAARCG
jgi:hypothetical protein